MSEIEDSMFKKKILKIFLLCLGITFIFGVAIVHIFHNLSEWYVISLLTFTYIINTILTINFLKKIFSEENKDRENALIKQVENSSNHLATIMNNMPLIAYITDINYNFVAGNTEAMKFFGINEQGQLALLSRRIYEKSTLEHIKEENEYIIKNKQTFITDKLIKLTTGKQTWMRIRKVPILDNKNEVKGFIVFARDISIEKSAQKQRETYIATLSHDLKIPTLAQIRAIELLLSQNTGNINEEQKELLNLTLDSCNQMYDMLSTILSTYKYENDDVLLSFEKVQLLPLIDDAFSKSFKTIRNKNIQIKISAENNFISLYADEGQIKKAIENLVDSCVSFAYENTEILCQINKINNDKIISISLGFESPYINTDMLRNLFKKYVTPAEKMDKVGNGLGLYLAKQIIDAHNGNIYVEAREANYNTFNVELPCINECKNSTVVL